MGLFNGDLGVCLKDENEELWLFVGSGPEIKKIKPQRIIHFNPAYFLTVHKSQGSEFDHVNLLLPHSDHPLLTRELVYMAITRAKKKFSLYGSLEIFRRGMSRETRRYTGLKELMG